VKRRENRYLNRLGVAECMTPMALPYEVVCRTAICQPSARWIGLMIQNQPKIP